ncbi:P-type ATPase [Planoprotostelium fungivorum]|uniref:Calcium-transporting ATPase n=1 Tax=Planoprotostelium fungivorum TaxID=1890364 RepID=A0A2P6NJT8_9EUKA|nr:P-type ATPase [Planoprotostelium fungivorum]
MDTNVTLRPDVSSRLPQYIALDIEAPRSDIESRASFRIDQIAPVLSWEVLTTEVIRRFRKVLWRRQTEVNAFPIGRVAGSSDTRAKQTEYRDTCFLWSLIRKTLQCWRLDIDGIWLLTTRRCDDLLTRFSVLDRNTKIARKLLTSLCILNKLPNTLAAAATSLTEAFSASKEAREKTVAVSAPRTHKSPHHTGSMSWEVGVEELKDLIRNRETGQSREDLHNRFNGIHGLAQKLKSDTSSGLPSKEASTGFSSRKEQYGTNVIPQRPATSYFEFLKDALSDRTLIILIIAAVVSLVLGLIAPPKGEDRSTSWIEGASILLAVVIISNVTAANDYKKDRQFRQLAAITEDRKIKVVRDGQNMLISIDDIVVGDLVILQTGDFIPADMSAMTGEPDAVLKSEENPWLLSGCSVTEGLGRGIVVATGMHSQWGQIKASLEKEQRTTPLQDKLEIMADNIGKGGLISACITLLALLIRWAVRTLVPPETRHFSLSWFSEWVEYVIISITIVAVAIPEGLPLAVTLSLAFSMFQMMKDNNLVRHLVACETMGGATQICSDKTGTLTQNRMTVVRLWLDGYVQEDEPNDPGRFHPVLLENLTENCCINSAAYIQKRNSDRPEFVGLKTECALLVMSDHLGKDYEQENAVQRMWPFSSSKKRMSTIIQKNNQLRLYTKGASEVILELCNRYTDRHGKVVEISPSIRAECTKTIEKWASQGLRTLTLCHLDLPSYTQVPKDGDCPFETSMILDAIIGIQDPLRPEVPASVELCKRAGITVRMLTGDNILTASYIARQCGILTDGFAMEGPEFRNLTQYEMDKIIPRLQVMARCSPEDKLTLVRRLIELGEVVAVTGDGTNDVPALKEADVGFAMGISGTEVAKDACDIIILDDNFSSIEKAVMWGRGVYDSIQKFLQFQLTVNIAAVIVSFMGAVSDGDSPLKAVQLLWVNLIMDTLAALALATERPGPELYERPPNGRFAPLITFKMWRHILIHAVYQVFVLMGLFYAVEKIEMLECNRGTGSDVDIYRFEIKRSSIIFNAFVMCQIFNEFNARFLQNELNMFAKLGRAKIFLIVQLIVIVMQFIIVQFGGEAAKTSPLDLDEWIFCIIVGAFEIPLGFLSRFVPTPKERDGKVKEVSEERQGLLGHDATAEDDEDVPEPAAPAAMHNVSRVTSIALRTKPVQNWRIAKRILTQIRVVNRFRRTNPHHISGTSTTR